MISVEVTFEERYWYPEDGGVIWVAGYHVVDPQTGVYLGRDAPELAARGLRITGVAGAAAHHAAALASDGAAPGEPLALRRDPANPHDQYAIAVDTRAEEQLGWVPRDLAAELAPELDAGHPYSAVVLRDRRASPRDERTGVTMLIAAADEVELRVVPRPR